MTLRRLMSLAPANHHRWEGAGTRPVRRGSSPHRG